MKYSPCTQSQIKIVKIYYFIIHYPKKPQICFCSLQILFLSAFTPIQAIRYALSIFFLVVKTNGHYQVVGSFVTQQETTIAIKEALNSSTLVPEVLTRVTLFLCAPLTINLGRLLWSDRWNWKYTKILGISRTSSDGDKISLQLCLRDSCKPGETSLRRIRTKPGFSWDAAQAQGWNWCHRTNYEIPELHA